MKLRLDTFHTGHESTGGILYVDGKFQCFTCEDQYQEIKVLDETRIPAGRYQILLRNEGMMTKRYAKRFPFHQGMLHLQNVPGFEWIYVHIGNTDDHTSGCILVGQSITVRGSEAIVGRSEQAYVNLYRKVVGAINNADEVWIEIIR